MQKRLTAILCFILSLVILSGQGVFAMPAGTVSGLESTAMVSFSTPSFFGKGMLFQQNKAMNIWGMAAAGSKISGELYKNGGKDPIEKIESAADPQNRWSLSFAPRAGGYDVYTIVIYENGTEKLRLTDIVVGELWLATGQSNMEFVLSWAVGGQELIQKANDRYIRVLLEPGDPYGVTNDHPSTPDYDIKGCRWGCGNNGSDLGMVSAMAYIAVLEMRKELDVPVGFINASIGATSIQAWMSRESIEGSPFVYDALTEKNLYISPEAYESGVQQWTAMSACYNTKIGPLAGMNIAGVLWCQGESNCDGFPNKTGYYSAALKALAEGYSGDFGFENASIPFLVAHIAPHNYNSNYSYIGYWIEEVTAACKAYQNVNQLPLYDAPLVYKDPPAANFWPIHPSDKMVIGRRLGLAALHNVYHIGEADYYAPVVKSIEIKGNKIIVAFDHVAEGLDIIGGGKDVHGFAICDSGRKFTAARAKIISSDTVEIWNDGVENPVAVTYAFASFNSASNLCNSYGLPAIPFRSDTQNSTYLAPCDWLTCDSATVWVSNSTTAEDRPTWSGCTINGTQSTAVSIDKSAKAEGAGSLKLTYTADEAAGYLAGAGPILNYYLMPHNLSQYNFLSVFVRNEDQRDKQFSLLIKTDYGVKYKVAAANVSDGDPYVHTVPAKSGFTRYVFDLSDIAPYDSEENAGASIIKKRTSKLQFTFKDSLDGSVYIDGVELGFVMPGQLSYPYMYWYGDINRDGKILASDALAALQHSVGKITLADEAFTAADVDSDGKVSAADALMILQRAVNKIDRFPAEEEQ